MSFLQLQKYPPSLHYFLATFTVLLSLYAIFESASHHDWLPRLRAFIEVFGRVPFLFYVLHIFLIHTAALIASYVLHADWHFWIGPGSTWGDSSPDSWGFNLPVVYAIWIAVILTLYLPCRLFSQVKARRRDWWLSYL